MGKVGRCQGREDSCKKYTALPARVITWKGDFGEGNAQSEQGRVRWSRACELRVLCFVRGIEVTSYEEG
eukprot:6868366-Prymnesium_polylepis.2